MSRPPIFDGDPFDILEDLEQSFFRGHFHPTGDIRSPLDDIFSTFERDLFRPSERFERRGRPQFGSQASTTRDNEIYDV